MTDSRTGWTASTLRQAIAGGATYARQLADLSHDEFVHTIERVGGQYVRFSNHGRFGVIVVGGADLPILPTGEPAPMPPGPLISEAEFIRLLDLAPCDASDRLYSAAMLAELLNVPESRVNAWAKAGLIRPEQIDRGVMRFAFRQVAIARTLSELTASGVSVDRLRRTLKKLQRQMPDLTDPLQQLTVLEHNGPLLVRLERGELADVSGQLQLDWDHDAPPAPVQMRLVPALTTAADWHEQGVEQERAGMLHEAEASYRHALQLAGPDATLVFDLASLLAKRGQAAQAIERYRQVTEIDPHHADAWNNLGILLADQGDHEAARYAFQRAIAEAPDNAMAHYNLADLLDTAGQSQEARRHWRAYLTQDPTNSPWAQHASRRLHQ